MGDVKCEEIASGFGSGMALFLLKPPFVRFKLISTLFCLSISVLFIHMLPSEPSPWKFGMMLRNPHWKPFSQYLKTRISNSKAPAQPTHPKLLELFLKSIHSLRVLGELYTAEKQITFATELLCSFRFLQDPLLP